MLDKAPDAEYEIKEEQRQRDEAKAQGKPIPQFPWHPPLASWGPGLLWNGMIAPLTPLPIRGAIWYQGESNSALERFPLYNRIMRTLIEDWRRQWGVGAFPFLYVQISNFKSTPAEDWASLRQQQVETLETEQHRDGRHHRHRQPGRRTSHRQDRRRAPAGAGGARISAMAKQWSTRGRCSARQRLKARRFASGSIMRRA